MIISLTLTRTFSIISIGNLFEWSAGSTTTLIGFSTPIPNFFRSGQEKKIHIRFFNFENHSSSKKKNQQNKLYKLLRL